MQTMQSAIVRLDGKMDVVGQAVSAVQVEVAGITATLSESKGRHEEEIAVLFRKDHDQSERTRKIELDYVPRGEFNGRQADHGKIHERYEIEQRDLTRRLGCLETKVVKLSLLAGAIIAVVQIALYAAAKAVFG